MNCDPNELSKASSCLFCGLSDHQLNLARIRTLCSWADAIGGTPVVSNARITEAGDFRITEAGDTRIIE